MSEKRRQTDAELETVRQALTAHLPEEQRAEAAQWTATELLAKVDEVAAQAVREAVAERDELRAALIGVGRVPMMLEHDEAVRALAHGLKRRAADLVTRVPATLLDAHTNGTMPPLKRTTVAHLTELVEGSVGNALELNCGPSEITDLLTYGYTYTEVANGEGDVLIRVTDTTGTLTSLRGLWLEYRHQQQQQHQRQQQPHGGTTPSTN